MSEESFREETIAMGSGAERSRDIPPSHFRARLQTGVLGASAILITLVMPALYIGLPWAPILAQSLSLLLVLGIGVGAIGRRQNLARWTLLALFPASLAMIVGAHGEFVEQSAFSPLEAVFSVVSVLAFVAASLTATSEHTKSADVTTSPLGEKSEVSGRGFDRVNALLSLGFVGALSLVILGPSWGGLGAWRQRWGEAAPEAAVLSVVLTMVMGVSVLAAIFGPAVGRRSREHLRGKMRRQRIGVALLVGTIGGVGYLMLQTLE